MLLSRLRILQVFVEMVAGSHLKTLERPFEATCVKVGKSVVTLGPYSGTQEIRNSSTQEIRNSNTQEIRAPRALGNMQPKAADFLAA